VSRPDDGPRTGRRWGCFVDRLAIRVTGSVIATPPLACPPFKATRRPDASLIAQALFKKNFSSPWRPRGCDPSAVKNGTIAL
jgi:hypothetical protein